MHALVPGFDSVYQHKAVFLFRLLTPLFVFVGLAGVATAILNSQHRFFLAASQKVIVNVIVLCGLFAWSSSTGIEWLAKLIVAGTAVYAVALVGQLFLSDVRPRFSWASKWELRAILVAILLPFSALTIRQASVLFERAIASFLPAGGISALTYNFQIVGGFSTVISAGLVTVLLPRLAQQNAGHERLALMRQGFYYLLVILLPMAMGAFLLSRSFVSILFFHGAFSAANAELATRVFRMYAFSMLFPEMVALLQVPFWADQRYRLLIAHNGMMAGVNVALDLLLVRMMGLPGLALGFTLTGITSSGRMAWLLHRDYGLLCTKERLSDLFKPLAATLAMLAVILAVQRPFSAFVFSSASPFRNEIGRTGTLVVLGALAYIIAGISTRMEPFPAINLSLRNHWRAAKRT
jgi:putative peptidoglycan lipid II flippase